MTAVPPRSATPSSKPSKSTSKTPGKTASTTASKKSAASSSKSAVAKKRGRPKGSTNKPAGPPTKRVLVETAKVAFEDIKPEKRGRGRPPGRKNDPRPGAKISLDRWRASLRISLREDEAGETPESPKNGDRELTEAATRELRERLKKLHDKLTAEGKRSVLVVLQAMDTGGKDGTVKNIYLGINPSQAAVHSFTVPSEEELAHDFLWRIHAKTPARGQIAIFNRSHYEDVLAVRVRNIAPSTVWRPRYRTIVDFENGLHANGTTVVKIMLHISKDEQKARLQARIDRPDKRWKFRMGDIEDRKLWSDYKRAYEEAIRQTSTTISPWYIVPADKKWYRDYAVMSILVSTLEAMEPKYPDNPELDGLKVP